jgi:hypothetical protein
MENVLVGLAVLACPVGMGLMMWFMGKGMRRGDAEGAGEAPSVEDLRREHARIGAELERIELRSGDAGRR